MNLWKQRNKRAHNPPEEQLPISTQELHAQVKFLYNEKRKLHPEIQHKMFPITAQEMMTKKNEYVKLWLEQTKPLLQSARARTQLYERQITDYFTTNARPPGNPPKANPENQHLEWTVTQMFPLCLSVSIHVLYPGPTFSVANSHPLVWAQVSI